MSLTTVLVVEDRENWRTTFSELLEDLGYNVRQAGCGGEFMESATKTDVNVIVLDISMPYEPGGVESRTAGLEALLHLQENYPDHPAVQNPIVRSMLERSDFKGTKLDAVRVDPRRWVSRNYTNASMLKLISEVAAITQGEEIDAKS